MIGGEVFPAQCAQRTLLISAGVQAARLHAGGVQLRALCGFDPAGLHRGALCHQDPVLPVEPLAAAVGLLFFVWKAFSIFLGASHKSSSLPAMVCRGAISLLHL